jgi:F-type H+-transporting ATPase subunit epsilon
MAELQLIVVTPESTVLETTAKFVALPLYDGEIGILPGRAPLIGRLGYGELRVEVSDHETVRLYVDGGFVQVAAGVVSVLTNRAVPETALDAEVARAHLASAMARKADTDEAIALRERLERQARAQLRLAQRSTMPAARSH